MELIIGGCFQGKLAYAKQRWKEAGTRVREEEILDGGSMVLCETAKWCGARSTEKDSFACVRILNQLHLLVRRFVETGKTQEIIPLMDQLLADWPDLLIVCDEVGLGLIPVEETERLYREAVGRTLCHLARQARQMVRITGGFPLVIRSADDAQLPS